MRVRVRVNMPDVNTGKARVAKLLAAEEDA
jgi:hypothetical protein